MDVMRKALEKALSRGSRQFDWPMPLEQFIELEAPRTPRTESQIKRGFIKESL